MFFRNFISILVLAVLSIIPSTSSAPINVALTQHRSFLKDSYRVKGDDQVFQVRQVPGDGGCLFHAITAWVTYLQTSKHLDFDWRMRNLSQKLRHLAVHILQTNDTLVLENGDLIDSSLLLEMIAGLYNVNATEYCTQILDPRTWGGGPEIVALSNHFKCPIHVYQLGTARSFMRLQFSLELCAKFGSPNFDARTPIYLLCADGRFPHIKPGQHKKVGDHFLALFPVARSLERTGIARPEENFLESSLIHGGGSDGSLPQARGEGGKGCPMWDMGRCPEINTDATFVELLRKESRPETNANAGCEGAPESGRRPFKWFKRSE